MVSTIEGEQATMGVTAAGRDAESENSRRGSTPTTLRLLTRSSPDRGSVTIFGIQYFIERGTCPSKREMELDSLVGEPWLRKTGDQRTPRGIYHSLLPPPPPRALDRRSGCDWWGQDTCKQSTWPLDLERRAPSVRFTGDQLPLGDAGDLHHQQEVGDHQQGLGEVSK
jgi:hypothetical protein